MRNRTEEINVRVFKTEKNLIRRKARKCGMNMSEYLRTLGTDATVKEAPREELMQAYRKLTRLHDGIRYEVSMAGVQRRADGDRGSASDGLPRRGGRCRWR